MRASCNVIARIRYNNLLLSYPNTCKFRNLVFSREIKSGMESEFRRTWNCSKWNRLPLSFLTQFLFLLEFTLASTVCFPTWLSYSSLKPYPICIWTSVSFLWQYIPVSSLLLISLYFNVLRWYFHFIFVYSLLLIAAALDVRRKMSKTNINVLFRVLKTFS